MTFLPLQLHAQPVAWRVFTTRKADPAFLKFQTQIFERDNYTCQFCGFQARQFQQVINKDNNYHNNKKENFVTACCFCTQCLFVESINNNEYGGGVMIYLPEISQSNLNGLCHVLFCAIANATSYRGDAQNIYRTLKFRSQTVEQTFGTGLSDPSRLGQMLIDSPIKDKEITQKKIFRDLRLLPSRTKFTRQIDTWAKSAREEMASTD